LAAARQRAAQRRLAARGQGWATAPTQRPTSMPVRARHPPARAAPPAPPRRRGWLAGSCSAPGLADTCVCAPPCARSAGSNGVYNWRW